MHPRQAKIISESFNLSAKINQVEASEDKEALSSPVLWKYTTPEGMIFYTGERQMTIKSPWTGKTFTVRPERMTPSQVGTGMRNMPPEGEVQASKEDWTA